MGLRLQRWVGKVLGWYLGVVRGYEGSCNTYPTTRAGIGSLQSLICLGLSIVAISLGLYCKAAKLLCTPPGPAVPIILQGRGGPR